MAAKDKQEKSPALTESFGGPGGTHAEPGPDVQASAEASAKTKGADAAVGAVAPAESQIRGSFMPGGGAGEDSHTAYDPETHAAYPATATEDERKAAIDKHVAAQQDRFEQAQAEAQDEGRAVAHPAGFSVPNPAPTEAALAQAPAVPED